MAARLSTSIFAKLTKNEMASLDVLVRLCRVLACQLSDICTIDFKERV
ncbi:MAG: helix-turn-helix domain-containing protein [Lachnospiraceae bacterium]|nr:helix-turn-helix domain-containing protein [Lachnospiraceae bacterium]